MEESGRQILCLVARKERRGPLRPGRHHGRPTADGGATGARSMSRRRQLVHHGTARGSSAGCGAWWASGEPSGSADGKHREPHGEGGAREQGSEDPPAPPPPSLGEEEVGVRRDLLGPVVERRGRSRQQVYGHRTTMTSTRFVVNPGPASRSRRARRGARRPLPESGDELLGARLILAVPHELALEEVLLGRHAARIGGNQEPSDPRADRRAPRGEREAGPDEE